MADTLDEAAAFWLPSKFFDEPILPTEFPYSLEIDCDNKQSPTSPQSTLLRGRSAAGSSSCSPNAAVSPPMTPSGLQNDVVGALISQAAGEVAKLKLSNGDGPGPTKHVSLMGPARTLLQLYPNPSMMHAVNQQKPWYTELEHSWPIHPNPARIIGPGTGGGGAAVRKGRAGTGVFLPRKYGNFDNNYNNNNIKIDSKAHPSDSRKMTGYPSSGYIPNRGFDGMMNGSAHLQPLCHPKMGFVSDYDLLMARRNNAVMLQQQRVCHGGDYHLPQSWTY